MYAIFTQKMEKRIKLKKRKITKYKMFANIFILFYYNILW